MIQLVHCIKLHAFSRKRFLVRICCRSANERQLTPGAAHLMQGFSTANSNKRSKSSELNRRLSHIVPEYVQALEPALVMFENVRGMLRHPQVGGAGPVCRPSHRPPGQ